MPFMCTSSTRKDGGGIKWLPVKIITNNKVGCGKGLPVEIITGNSVETVVFGNTNIPHPCNHTVPLNNDSFDTV